MYIKKLVQHILRLRARRFLPIEDSEDGAEDPLLQQDPDSLESENKNLSYQHMPCRYNGLLDNYTA